MLNEVVHRETVTCTVKGNPPYKGTADIAVTVSDDTVTVTVLRYMITRSKTAIDYDSERNKANINVEVHGSSGAKSKAKSPDAMIQDGEWHDLFLSTQVPRGTRTTDSYEGSVQFVFDENWWTNWWHGPDSDPSCTPDPVVFPRS